MTILEHYENIYHNEQTDLNYHDYDHGNINDNDIDKKKSDKNYNTRRYGSLVDLEDIQEDSYREGFTEKPASSIENKKSTTGSLWKLEGNIVNQLENMASPLAMFTFFTVVNIIIVYIVWKIGSHIMWFNSIPRTLLESIYPPSYEYLSAVLKENSKPDSVCRSNVEESGGMKTTPAVYTADQINAVEERNECCAVDGAVPPGYPYPPGSKVELECFPLNTSAETSKNYTSLNKLYKIIKPPDYQECIFYDEWIASQEIEVDQADQRLSEARAKLKLSEGQQGGGDEDEKSGKVVNSNILSTIVKALSNNATTAAPEIEDEQLPLATVVEKLKTAFPHQKPEEIIKLAERISTDKNKEAINELQERLRVNQSNDENRANEVLDLFTQFKNFSVGGGGQHGGTNPALQSEAESIAEKEALEKEIKDLEGIAIDGVKEAGEMLEDGEEEAAVSFVKGLEKTASVFGYLFRSLGRFVTGCTYDSGGMILGLQTPTSFFTKISVGMKASISSVVFLALSSGSSNIIVSALIGLLGIAIGCSIVNALWFSPLTLIWMLYSFNLGRFGWLLLLLGLIIPPLGAFLMIPMGVVFSFYILTLVIGKLWIGGVFGNKGEKWKSSLKNCPDVRTSLRRLFIVLTFINAFQHLRYEVVIGMVLCFLGIEYYYHSATGRKLAAEVAKEVAKETHISGLTSAASSAKSVATASS